MADTPRRFARAGEIRPGPMLACEAAVGHGSASLYRRRQRIEKAVERPGVAESTVRARDRSLARETRPARQRHSADLCAHRDPILSCAMLEPGRRDAVSSGKT